MNIYGLYHGWNLPNAADATEKLKTQSAAGFRSVWMAASDEAASDEVQLALAALTERIPIITCSVITKRGDYALSYLDCGCGRRSEQRMQTESRTLLECVSSLGELVEKKHATCIANRVAELETASAAAAHRENLGALGTMMAAATARATSERREAELLAAQELVKKTKVAAATAEKHAKAARRAEVEAAAPFLAPRKAAESEAATLAAAAATARSALAELQSDAKRARVEEADDEPPPVDE